MKVPTIPKTILKPWLILAGSSLCMMLLSYIRFAYTGVLTVDFIKFQGWASYAAAIAFFSLLCIFGYGYYRIVMNYEGWTMNRHEITVLSLWTVLMAVPMLPMLSNDLFSVFAYGDLALKGLNPYYGNNLLHSDMSHYVSTYWKTAPCAYGPVSVGISAAALAIGGTDNLFNSVMAFKAINTIFVIIFILAVSRMEGTRSSRFNVHALVLLSPILWLQGSGQGHLDMVAVAFVSSALMSALANRYFLAAVLAALAFNVKITGMIVCPLLLLMLWHNYRHVPWRFAANALICIGIFAVITVLVWLPFYQGIQTITEPMSFILSKSHGIMQRGILILVKLMLKAYYAIGGDIGKAELTAITKSYAFPVSKTLTVFFLFIFIYNAGKFLKKTVSPQTYITFFAIIGTAFFTISANAFYPWYLLMILPFYLYLDDRRWVIWAIITGITVPCLDIEVLIAKSNFANFLNKTAVVAMTGLFFWGIPSRYFHRGKSHRNT